MLEAPQEQFGNVQQQKESKFICSPSIFVHRKVELQDAEVNEIKDKFHNLCSRY